MSDASADVQTNIGRQWIKAHLLGGIPFNAVPAIVDFIIRGSGTIPGHMGSSELLVLGISFVAAYSLPLIVLGYLSGVVLRQKLPLFPLRAWLGLFGLFGVLIGLLAATAWLDEVSDSDKFDNVAVFIVAAVLVMLIGAAAGALQALVLRKSAKGLRTWIAYSAIAALPIIVMAPTIVYGPASGLTREVLEFGAGLCATVAGALIMLPAVGRLSPR
jgi:hypothetical protein